MVHYVQARDSLDALSKLLKLTLSEGDRVGDKIELLSVLVAIGHNESQFDMKRFLVRYRRIVGSDLWKRAETLYRSTKPLRWKVSYRGRLVGGGPSEEENQLQAIALALSRTPGANTLSFSFYR